MQEREQRPAGPAAGWATVGVVVWSVGLAVVLVWLFHSWNFDDPYITYRYAANLAEGRGFVYNVGERVLSTTTPLYALLLAPVRLFGLSIPLAGSVIGAISLAAAGLLFWLLGRAWQTERAGLVGLILLPTSLLLTPTIGGEMPLSIALILGGFLAVAHRREGWGAVLLALATLTRADGVLAAVAAAGSILVGSPTQHHFRWRALLRYGVRYGAILAPWLLVAWGYFGSPFPATLTAKQHQGMLPGTQRFLAGWLEQLLMFWENPFLRLQLIAAVAGMGMLAGRGRPWLLVVGYTLLYLVGYTLLGVSGYFWYYAPLAVGLIALAALGIELVCSLPPVRALSPLARSLVALLLVLPMLYPQAYLLLESSDRHAPRLPLYREVGEWLHTHTPPGASVGTLEVGVIGYYAQRRMIDFAGLLQPEIAQQLTPTTSYEHAAVWAFHTFRPDYLVLHDGVFAYLETAPAFRQRCKPVTTFVSPAYPHRLVVYSCTHTRTE